ncbi:MAG: RNA methyltransferase [Patescibacteria group bacterium]
MLAINSRQNPAIKDLLRLKKSAVRKQRGLFLVDGHREIAIARQAGWEIINLFYCPVLSGGRDLRGLALADEQIRAVSEPVFRQVCYKDNPDGCLAVARAKSRELAGIRLDRKPLIMVLEGVEKPGNLGAIMRTAYAAGVSAIIINAGQTDLYNPNVIRASEGQVFTQQIALATAAETIDWLKQHQIRSFAAATGGAKKYTDCDLSGALALVFGSEADGLSQVWLKAANGQLQIPMKPGIDSLNVSAAAAIILFEAVRQRS